MTLCIVEGNCIKQSAPVILETFKSYQPFPCLHYFVHFRYISYQHLVILVTNSSVSQH